MACRNVRNPSTPNFPGLTPHPIRCRLFEVYLTMLFSTEAIEGRLEAKEAKAEFERILA
jgi:hypothetical protein